jgi:TusE/DsrC/DsvC family sulfur relay protein
VQEEKEMPMTTLGGAQVEVDEDGFIQQPEQWSQNVAADLAKTEGVEQMGDYQKFGIAPMVRKLCKDLDFKLKYIYELFPSGPAKGACKVAGLPKPTGCV